MFSLRKVQGMTCRPAAWASATRGVGFPSFPSAPLGMMKYFSGPIPSANSAIYFSSAGVV